MPPTADLAYPILFLIAGVLLLYFGAEGLVRGSASIALRMRIAPLIVGLTIVAFGTSSPELVVSISAALKGNPGIALGNVIGSNICNIALILGIAAIVRPIKVNIKVIKVDISIMIGITLLLILMLLDGEIDRIDGILLTIGVISYCFFTIFLAKNSNTNNDENELEVSDEKPPHKKWLDIVFIVVGLAILIVGANLFVSGATVIAEYLGASDIIIGLTIVAFGTSLPELATSLVASIKGESDISIGNVVGSNIFNILGVLGITSIIHPIYVGEISMTGTITPVDVGVMVLVAIIISPLAWSKLTISRIEGAFLLFIYIGYVFYLYTKTDG
ncbi:MAG: calcium/sodium antiporter [Candidatus Kapabacteria bacterium]|jgi:cation:H+ antiporter|nr:calcium/sodium antiporter [Candidatus Kapabacteria bacterium]